MIKVLGDIHWGMRHNSSMFHSILMDSLNWFLKDLKKSDSVIILGDIFDSRSSVDFKILNDALDFFIQLTKKCKEVYILVGNHDLYYKENDINNVNCRFLRFNPTENSKIAPVKIVHETSVIKIQNKSCLFIPWIDSIEKKEVANEFLTHTYDLVLGHMDTVGLYGDSVQSELMFSPKDLGNNETILSGHYHKRYIRYLRGRVNYVGALINQTFNDVGDVKGYHTFNKNNEVQFVKGISPSFEYVTIPNTSGFLQGFKSAPNEEKLKIQKRIQGNIIKLILNEYGAENDELYKLFKDMNPLEISISYNRVNFEEDNEEEFTGFDYKSDIVDIISQYIERVKNKLPDGIQPSDINELILQKHNQFKIEN